MSVTVSELGFVATRVLSRGGPGGPCGREGPVAPGGPWGPAGPWGPCDPCEPGSPCGPWAPVGPGRPCGPCEPAEPGSPCGPGSPVSPCNPAGPGKTSPTTSATTAIAIASPLSAVGSLSLDKEFPPVARLHPAPIALLARPRRRARSPDRRPRTREGGFPRPNGSGGRRGGSDGDRATVTENAMARMTPSARTTNPRIPT